MAEDSIEEKIKECNEIFSRMEKREEKANDEVVKYFDRIHDKLFSYHLFFLAGYISLIAIPSIRISVWWLIIPVFCVARLICIDWSMMNINRKLAHITNLNPNQIRELSKKQNSITLNSLEVILESILTTGGFIWALI
ncbi:MAG: hypothetical protein J6R32_08425 [Bacteroidales bacterium]|nr:hypothetical protein [Bacteroidales bacterium]